MHILNSASSLYTSQNQSKNNKYARKQSFFSLRYFEKFVMTLIFFNSIFLAIYDYSDRDDVSLRNEVLNYGGRVFTIFFTLEMIFKVIAYGFIFHKKSYLRDGWNWLDFIVVIIGWIELIPSIPNFRGIRTFRVLRPLRAINSITNLKN